MEADAVTQESERRRKPAQERRVFQGVVEEKQEGRPQGPQGPQGRGVTAQERETRAEVLQAGHPGCRG